VSLNPPVPFRHLADAAERLRRASQTAVQRAQTSKKDALPKVVLTIGQADQLAELIEKGCGELEAAEERARDLGAAPDTVEVL
jgi:hypothetical protein